MVNNTVAMIGIGLYLLGLYQRIYELGDYKIGIIFCSIGAALIMFEFLSNGANNDEVIG